MGRWCRRDIGNFLQVEVQYVEGFAARHMGVVQHETVQFSGRVQGVGFRYATLQLAKEFEVTGYVKNMTDGRVLMEVEGTPAEITAFIHAIEEQMYGYIRKIERTSANREAVFQGFEIR